jgi:hypothetical protein
LTSLVGHDQRNVDGSDDDATGLLRYPSGDLIVGLDTP